MNEAEFNEMIEAEQEGQSELQEMFENKTDVQLLSELSEELYAAKQNEKDVREAYDAAKKERIFLEERLLQVMENSGMESFRNQHATFSVLNGLRASCRKEDNPQFFSWLETIGIDPISIVSINSRTLASMVKDWKEQGIEIPEYIWSEPTKKIGMRRK
jgi:aconitase A